MRFFLLGLGLLGLLAALPHSPQSPRLLDQRLAEYQEDEPGGRQLASLEARLERQDGSTRLQLRISALGPGVDPALGSQGLPGANHVTARELEDLHQENALFLVSKGKSRERWRMQVSHRGPVPELRLDPAALAVDALQVGVPSRQDFVLEMQGRSGPLALGRHELYLEARGIPRLRIDLVVDQSGASILGMKSLGQHHLESRP